MLTEPLDLVEVEAKPHHLPALDGLRAIAVLLVIGFHFRPDLVPGGFLGVDLFFVLSGFLITSLLVRELDDTGRVRILAFWGRRARRLFPALGVMLAAVALMAIFESALEQLTVFQEGVATLLYANNWWLILRGTSYFDALQQPSPLLHTWSLGIEEQFYVVFPLILLVVFVLAAKWGVARLRTSRLLLLIGGLAAASALWSAWLATHDGSFDRLYFGTDARAIELLVGGMLGVLLIRRPWTSHSATRTTTAVGIAGALVLVVLLAVTRDGARWFFPGGMIALSVGAVAVIWSATHRDSPLAKPLTWRPLLYVGVISYGLYLWHWPLAVWFGASNGLGVGTSILCLLLTFGIAILSYHLIEMPIRRQEWGWESGRRGVMVAAVTPLVIAALLAVCTPNRSDATIAAAIDRFGGLKQPTSFVGTGPRMFLVGDSVVGTLSRGFALSPPPGLSYAGSNYLGCAIVPDHLALDGKDITNTSRPCPEFYQLWTKAVTDLKPDLGVAMLSTGQYHQDIMGSDGTVIPFGTPQYRTMLTGVIDEVTAKLRAGSTKVAWIDATCNAIPFDNEINRNANDYSRTQWINGVLRDYLREHSDVGYFNISSWDCGSSSAEATANARARKFDGLHFTDDGAEAAWRILAPQALAFLSTGARAPLDGSTPTATANAATSVAAPTPNPAGTNPATNPGLVQPASFMGSGPSAFIVGDDIAGGFVRTYSAVPSPGFSLAGSGYLGCTLSPDHIAVNGRDITDPSIPCTEWSRLWPTAVKTLKPKLGIAALSTIQYHQDIALPNGKILRFGTKEYRDHLWSVIDQTTRTLSVGSSRVAWIDATCANVPGGAPINDNVNDFSRTQWVNLVLMDYVAKHPAVRLLNLSSWDCGYSAADAQRNATLYKPDGLHYSDAGYAAAWSVLAPQIVAATR